jgi:hypothetical protein
MAYVPFYISWDGTGSSLETSEDLEACATAAHDTSLRTERAQLGLQTSMIHK